MNYQMMKKIKIMMNSSICLQKRKIIKTKQNRRNKKNHIKMTVNFLKVKITIIIK